MIGLQELHRSTADQSRSQGTFPILDQQTPPGDSTRELGRGGERRVKSAKFEEAIEKYTEALERIGENEEEGKGEQIRATLLSNRATTLLKLERHKDALADTDASLLLSSSSFKALRTRARLHLHLERFDASDFKSAIENAGGEGADAHVRALRAELKKAEAALKRSKTKDYYKILGVARRLGYQEGV
ncbi:hypothetical protein H0H92_015753 [Tricholoma furcatifolium]|nr:hypothetical protein H0H92_015753 [Tricholoma furcatifolium]